MLIAGQEGRGGIRSLCHPGSPTRRTISWKRTSFRSGFIRGSTPIHASQLDRWRKAFSSDW